MAPPFVRKYNEVGRCWVKPNEQAINVYPGLPFGGGISAEFKDFSSRRHHSDCEEEEMIITTKTTKPWCFLRCSKESGWSLLKINHRIKFTIINANKDCQYLFVFPDRLGVSAQLGHQGFARDRRQNSWPGKRPYDMVYPDAFCNFSGWLIAPKKFTNFFTFLQFRQTLTKLAIFFCIF